jgi:hypothetical protein
MNKDELARVAKKQIETSVSFKQPRLEEIKKSLDLYANVVSKALPGRFNVPIPIMGGFVDTLKSKIDEAPNIIFTENDETDYKKVLKANAMLKWDSSPVNGKWALKDRAAKTMAIFSGRGVYKIYAESDPKYKSCLEPIDLFDFIFEPQGGGDLDQHLFVGQMNIFKSRSELLEEAKSGYYDKMQVGKLLMANETDDKNPDDEYQNKVSRYSIYGLDPEINNYVGEAIYPLTELYTTYQGKRYKVVLDFKTGLWLQIKELTEVFKSGRHPFVSWATHEDYFQFLSKAPVDDIRLVAEASKIIFNQALDNIQKRNWNMRAYDADVFPDPSQLQWRPDGLIKANNLSGKSIQQGIYSFETPDNTSITVNMMTFLDNFIGAKTGITPGSQGQADQGDKVGIYYGNMQQVAERLGLINKSYTEAHAELGIRYIEGLDEHLTEDISVKVQGITGVEWTEVKKSDFKFERFPEVNVESSATDAQMDELKKKRRMETLLGITKNPPLLQKVNIGWVIREMLKNGEYTDEEVRVSMDTMNDGNAEILSEAAIAIKEIISGETPKLNRGATTGFVQKVLDFEIEHELKPELAKKLRDFAQAHIPIAMRNMLKSRPAPQEPQEMGGGMELPEPMTPQGQTQQRSANISEQITA